MFLPETEDVLVLEPVGLTREGFERHEADGPRNPPNRFPSWSVLGQSPVREVRGPWRIDEDVVRLNVPVEHAKGVRVGQGGSDVRDDNSNPPFGNLNVFLKCVHYIKNILNWKVKSHHSLPLYFPRKITSLRQRENEEALSLEVHRVKKGKDGSVATDPPNHRLFVAGLKWF